MWLPASAGRSIAACANANSASRVPSTGSTCVAASSFGSLYRRMNHAAIVCRSSSIPIVNGYDDSPSRCDVNASLITRGVACCGSPIDRRIGDIAGGAMPAIKERNLSNG
jgi:hypothetical protein